MVIIEAPTSRPPKALSRTDPNFCGINIKKQKQLHGAQKDQLLINLANIIPKAPLKEPPTDRNRPIPYLEAPPESPEPPKARRRTETARSGSIGACRPALGLAAIVASWGLSRIYALNCA